MHTGKVETSRHQMQQPEYDSSGYTLEEHLKKNTVVIGYLELRGYTAAQPIPVDVKLDVIGHLIDAEDYVGEFKQTRHVVLFPHGSTATIIERKAGDLVDWQVAVDDPRGGHTLAQMKLSPTLYSSNPEEIIGFLGGTGDAPQAVIEALRSGTLGASQRWMLDGKEKAFPTELRPDEATVEEANLDLTNASPVSADHSRGVFKDLPLVNPQSTDVVVNRDAMISGMTQTVRIVGRSVDGGIIGRDGGGLVRINPEAFEHVPAPGIAFTLTRNAAGRDEAVPRDADERYHER